jgi:hypothetical protein
MMAVLDTWALAVQLRDFLAPGQAGGALFGAQQGEAGAAAGELASEAEELSRRLIAPGDFDRDQRFVAGYAREHPFSDLALARPSVVELWSRAQGAEPRLIDSLGTIPEAMTDFSDRLKISSDTLAQETLWRTQLALRESGYTGADVRDALKQLDERLAKLAAAAENAPHLVQGAVADVRRSVLDVLSRVDASSAAMIGALRSERAAFAADVSREREAIVAAADAERRALAQDAAQLAAQVVKSGGEEARHLAREVLVLLIVLAGVVLGLPFMAGYLLGRARAAGGPAAR